MINWTLIGSSTSDSASTQKKFNKLLQERRENDEEFFGTTCPEAIELVENFCCMHLGVNLCKAFLDGVKGATSVHSNASIIRQMYWYINFASYLGNVVCQNMVLVYFFSRLFGANVYLRLRKSNLLPT